MQTPPDPMPFDARRMIYADFETVHETGPGGPIGYVDGLVARVAGADRAALAAFDDATSALFQAQGATRLVSGWSIEIAPRRHHRLPARDRGRAGSGDHLRLDGVARQGNP